MKTCKGAFLKNSLISFAALALLAGCSGTPRLGDAGTSKVATVTELPAPKDSDLFAAARPYRIGPFDKLTFSVYGIKELEGEVQADASGRISVPLIGVVEASGRTPAELEQLIADGLRRNFVRNPQVTVNLKDTVSQVITVDGQVKEPGLYPVLGDMTLMRAVATAKGASENARLDDVVVFRTVEGKRYAALYNLKAIRRGVYDDPALFPNDIVVVGESTSRQLFKDILQAAPAILTPIIILLTNTN